MAHLTQEPEWVPASQRVGEETEIDAKRRSSKFDQINSSQVDWVSLKRDLFRMMKDPNWDDGSYGPILIRLAWHSSGTYDKSTQTGGTYNGATMRFKPEMDDPENAGLVGARNFLQQVKEMYPQVSYADLWVFAAYAYIENSGGPVIKFTPGRVDATAKEAKTGPRKAIKPGRLPGAETGLAPIRGGPEKWLDSEGRVKGWENLAKHIRDVFYRMGVNDQEIVALLCGGHVYGRCHPSSSGYAGPWVAEMTEFSNEYAADMVEDDWICVTNDDTWLDAVGAAQVRPAVGKRQYVNVAKPPTHAPSAAGFPVGQYTLTGDKWVNMRKDSNTGSAVIARPENGAVFNIVYIKTFGTAVRGQVDGGGWVSLVGSSGTKFFDHTGPLVLEAGKYRVKGEQPLFKAGKASAEKTGSFVSGEINITELVQSDGHIYGACDGGFVIVCNATTGVSCDRIIVGINDSTDEKSFEEWNPVPQMMLVSDMVLLWDAEFKTHLEKYAEDEELLKQDFGNAFKKLTELGQNSEIIGCPVAH